MENNISKLDNDFINLAKEDTLNISDIEDLLIKSISSSTVLQIIGNIDLEKY